MKPLRTLTTALLTFGLFTATIAATPIDNTNINDCKELKHSLHGKISHSKLNWDDQKNTEVVAEIYVNHNGTLEVKAINGDSVYKAYVEKQLHNMKIDKDALLGKTFIGRFKFRTS
ncbi:MAG: hypothetical protein RBR35_12315 [Salinivirgaceae bacterium]|nr:hypothetical protein [Salinivirgaceae bacterium]MDY0281332.1 hypothetical protein [Salinivirgaceae bacterium]